MEKHRLETQPGDSLILYTDGITETTDANGEMYGEKRLVAFVSENYGLVLNELLNMLLRDIQSFSGSGQLDDDLTVNALSKK